ncbi:MAG TPA: YkvA family protein [Chitinophagales bacterium]|nr:YkvA family protein [Chitinophagales bacterium]HNL84472.1 YkvA family protein [Chitinophagales bacterium]
MQNFFDSLYKKAEQTITSGTAISELIDEVFLKIGEASESFYKIQDTVLAMARMLRSWFNGDYKNISAKSIIAVVAALIYFVNPFDLIPDFIPLIGQIDDILILGYLIKIVNKEIERFMTWEENQSAVK